MMGKLHYQDSPSENERRSFAKFLAEDEQLVIATGFGRAYLRSQFIVGLTFPGALFMGLGGLIAYFFQFNLGIGILIGLILAIFVSSLKTLWTYHAHRYLLTTRRVIIKKGLLTVQLTSALFDKITHIEVEQSFFDKILMHHGTIIINTAGTNKGEITLNYIDYPIEFKNLLERLINKERSQFGLRVGPVETIEGEVV